MVIIYKVAPITALLGWKMIKVEHIGLVNLIAGRRLVPELIQFDATPEKIAQTVCTMLEDQEAMETLRRDLDRVRAAMGGGGASARTAQIALDML
jgi:lipid-A-disaccharide synthase